MLEGKPLFPEEPTEKYGETLNFDHVPVDFGFEKKLEILEEVQWSRKPTKVGVRGILLKKIKF